MKMKMEDKARAYTNLKKFIKEQKVEYQKRLDQTKADLESASLSIAYLCIGKKYAYMEFLESLEEMLNYETRTDDTNNV